MSRAVAVLMGVLGLLWFPHTGGSAWADEPQPDPLLEEAPDEVPPQASSAESPFELRAALGFHRSSFTETVSGVTTESAGQWTAPELRAEARFTPSRERPEWRGAGAFVVGKTLALNGTEFPVSFALGVRLERHGLDALNGSEGALKLSPSFGLSVENISEATPSYAQLSAKLLYAARTTTILWLEPGLLLEADTLGTWLEARLGLLVSPYGRTSSAYQDSRTVRGIGMSFDAACGVTEHLYFEVPVRLLSLGAGASVSGASVGFAVGWRQ